MSVSRLLVDPPDVVHSFGRLAYLAPLLRARVPKIMSYQREPTLQTVSRAASLARRGTLSFTGCSEFIAERIKPVAPAVAIPNGVNVDRYSARVTVANDAPLVFLGRIERIKGAHTAIGVARSAKRKLILAGNVVADSAGRAYFEREIAPHIDDDQVRFVGAVDDQQKNELLGSAAALLMPIEWEEPFGIVMAEALACGTPVVGFARGAVPEIVRHGKNGFLCETPEEMAALVPRLNEIDRAACRMDCEERFSDRVIVDAYERLYHAHAGR
jgi:glycosyltransferase involved in cell wall biosynthesis